MNNKYAIGTVVGAALLGLAKSNLLGSKNDGITVKSVEELLRYANDPSLAPLVTKLTLVTKNLTTLPPEIWKLKNLKALDLGRNQLTTLPKEIGNLTKLEELYLNGNPNFYMNSEELLQLILNGADKEIQKAIVEANVIPKQSNVRLR